MRYERPIVTDLSARVTSGQGPLACMAGGTVSGTGGCVTGGSDAACYTGASGAEFPDDDCMPGAAAGPSYSCLSGSAADWECAAGTGPRYAGTCTVGPSNV